MTDRASLALRAQAERIRAVEELRARGFSTIQAWALIRWRQEREERGMREPLVHLTPAEQARLRIARQSHVARRQAVPRDYRPHRCQRLGWRDVALALPGLILMGLALGIGGGLVAPRLAAWLGWG